MISVMAPWMVVLPVAAVPLSQPASTFNRAGAQFVLQATMRSAVQINAPCAIAVVDRSGELMAFDRFDNIRTGSPDLALWKARTSALMERPLQKSDDNGGKDRSGPSTAGFMALRGGMALKAGDTIVGAIGVAGIRNENDARIARDAATAFSNEAMGH